MNTDKKLLDFLIRVHPCYPWLNFYACNSWLLLFILPVSCVAGDGDSAERSGGLRRGRTATAAAPPRAGSVAAVPLRLDERFLRRAWPTRLGTAARRPTRRR